MILNIQIMELKMKKYYTTLFLLILFLQKNFGYDYYEIKIETRVEEQDKKFLNADFYSNDTNIAKPVILVQTPYNKDLYRIITILPDYKGQLNVFFDTINYNYVIMDWRGFYSNADAKIATYDWGKDGYDAVEWLAKQKWCNGKIGTLGGSALGLVQFLTACLQPPHLVAAVPMIKDYKAKYSDYYYGGALRREQVEAHQKLGFTTVEAITNHPDEDLFWNGLEKINDYPESFKVPMLLISGWFDHYPSDVMRAFKDIRARSDVSVRSQHKLIMGPWTHTGVGELQQGELEYPAAENVSNAAIKQFFDYYILGAKNGWPLQPVVRYYQLGDEQWRQTVDWNTVSNKYDTLYFNENRILKFEPPPPKMGPMAYMPDTIIYNPRGPSPTIGGSRFDPYDKNVPVGPYDISKNVETRSDILVYSTEPLAEDIIINGKITIELFVASDREDTDFSVRLCDVFPDDRSIIITQGIRRMRFRNGYAQEELMTPGTIYPVSIELSELGITFKKGHQLRIDITSSNYPMFDVNINDGGAMYVAGGDTLIATNLVYCSAENSSKIILPIAEPASVYYTQFISNDEIIVYPNPASSNISIKFDCNNVIKCDINIVDILGREVRNLAKGQIIQGNSELYFDVNGISQGIYYIKIIKNEGIITQPLLIVK